MIKHIVHKKDLKILAKQLGVRDDWHEPDEQGLEAIMTGYQFDNAGFLHRELTVTLRQNGEDVGEILLATLFAYACDTCE